MTTGKKEAVAPTTAKENIQQKKSYPTGQSVSTENHRAERIRKRRADIPKLHRKTYDQAMQGKSMKSAIKAFCLECVCWQKEEVRFCTSVACPLYLYRPYKVKRSS